MLSLNWPNVRFFCRHFGDAIFVVFFHHFLARSSSFRRFLFRCVSVHTSVQVRFLLLLVQLKLIRAFVRASRRRCDRDVLVVLLLFFFLFSSLAFCRPCEQWRNTFESVRNVGERVKSNSKEKLFVEWNRLASFERIIAHAWLQLHSERRPKMSWILTYCRHITRAPYFKMCAERSKGAWEEREVARRWSDAMSTRHDRSHFFLAFFDVFFFIANSCECVCASLSLCRLAWKLPLAMPFSPIPSFVHDKKKSSDEEVKRKKKCFTTITFMSATLNDCKLIWCVSIGNSLFSCARSSSWESQMKILFSLLFFVLVWISPRQSSMLFLRSLLSLSRLSSWRPLMNRLVSFWLETKSRFEASI